MRSNTRFLSLVLAVGCFSLSCKGWPDMEDVGLSSATKSQVVTNGFTLNGFTLNGFTLNGFTLNGFTLNGFTLNGFTLNGFTLNGTALGGLALNGTLFAGSAGASPVSGTALIGALASISVQPAGASQPTQYTLRFDDIYVDPQNPNGDVFLYNLTYALGGSSTWNSLCTDAAGNPVAAIPIRNYWNSQTGARVDSANVVTFACVSGALGKCVRLGYRPWATASSCQGSHCSTVSLADFHQACTRMIRADYCGNGTSYTLNGTPIDIYDSLSPSIQTRAGSWSVEAKWTPDGATCLADARHSELLANGRYPDCDGNGHPGDLPNCGNSLVLNQDALLGSTYDH